MGVSSVTMTRNIPQSEKTFKYCCDCKWNNLNKRH